MSKTIDMDKVKSGDYEGLTEDDLLWLAQRDRLPDDLRQDYERREEVRRRLSGATPMLADVANTGTVNSLGVTRADLEANGIHLIDDDGVQIMDDGLNPPEQFERTRVGQTVDDELDDEDSDLDEPEEDLSEVPYTDKRWTNDRLRAEIARRNAERDEDDQLSLDGRKEDLIGTLMQDDED